MDYDSYRKQYFTGPRPGPRFDFVGLHGMTLYFADDEAAVAYDPRAFGPPAYVEGESTNGWQTGGAWLTLLRAGLGSPQNVEVTIVMRTPHEAERLPAALVEAGGPAEATSDQRMYEPVRDCPVRDPFGTNVIIICPLQQQAG
jgi:hypothetical protein